MKNNTKLLISTGHSRYIQTIYTGNKTVDVTGHKAQLCTCPPCHNSP